ncbi:MAG: DUF2889 domain-containing protein [Deltaproteobacteria bacterium]|jgi:hypothetical protein|nr:DUF2889 domain-containing protein [Deltaproteobacteria bacterium]MBT4088110.1 DUF2889 domain-containing protein [Deltaproteobacteria bacterium]MBT4267942.1 DUF2889 domain-containing protein [Deltaproteobacteria bacterium]MBT4638525.1 DUF2889 domain-containing protein [Deltaproteobacteria bacterium]MBT6499860.1 DUF2889 domain-containing protein [Deltaproteobacteria bacterium]
MSRLKEMITCSAAHSRMIDMKTYVVDDDTVIVEGELRDDRYQAVYDQAGMKQNAGPIHHLVIRLLIRGKTMEIVDAEAEMLHVPHEECKITLESMANIIGLEIKGGFIKEVRKKIGGIDGCAHLTHLLTVMSQEVFQGIIVVQGKDRAPLPENLDDMKGLENLIGSCKMWEPGGLKLTRLQKAIEGRR